MASKNSIPKIKKGDFSKKVVKTKNGYELVPTTPKERKLLEKAAKEHNLDWVDELETLDAIFDDK